MESINNSPNWFEIPVSDFERARKFYSVIYDFDMPSAVMGENQLGFFPVQPKHSGGAIIQGKDCKPSQEGSLIYLNSGEDLNKMRNRVEEAGGKIALAKSAISPDHGFYALFIDTEGNKVALHSMK